MSIHLTHDDHESRPHLDWDRLGAVAINLALWWAIIVGGYNIVAAIG